MGSGVSAADAGGPGQWGSWTDDAIKLIIKRANRGVSYSKIAAEVSKLYRPGTTVGSISSRIAACKTSKKWRLRLKSAVRNRHMAYTGKDPATPRPRKTDENDETIARIGFGDLNLQHRFKGHRPRTDTTKPERWNMLPPLGPPIRTMTLPRTGRCRWPVVDDALPPTPGGYSCGAATDGHRYCQHHRMISLRKNRREA